MLHLFLVCLADVASNNFTQRQKKFPALSLIVFYNSERTFYQGGLTFTLILRLVLELTLTKIL